MTRLYPRLLTICALFVTLTASAQQGNDAIDQATKALDYGHKCDEAMRLLNGVPVESRQTAEYLLCMAKTQDCMQNSEQALYYYNKYLVLKPGDDAAKKRAAELTDTKNKQARVSGEENNAKAIYQTVSKNRKRRRQDLNDSYYNIGLTYGMGLSDKSPYKSEIGMHAGYGFVIINNHALLEINVMTGFLMSPNQTWVNNTLKPVLTPPLTNANMKGGLAEVFTMGFAPIVLNKKDIALTAGLIGGIHYYMFPGQILDYSSTSIDNTFTLCYGIKSNFYAGQNFMVFASYLFNSAKSADVSSGYISYSVPASYNMLNIGIAAKLDGGWWW